MTRPTHRRIATAQAVSLDGIEVTVNELCETIEHEPHPSRPVIERIDVHVLPGSSYEAIVSFYWFGEEEPPLG